MFGETLRRHRQARGMSQERLAQDAEISTRHLSYLETGRSSPSKTMVLLLGSALELPLRERNGLLEAAGFAAAYRDVPLDAPEAASLRRAIDLVLSGLEPNGAVACDREWNLIKMNDAAMRLFSSFADLSTAPPEVMGNIFVACVHPLGLRPAIVNFEEVAAMMLARARQENLDVVDKLIRGIPELPLPRMIGKEAEGPFITVHLRRNGIEGRFFTTIQTIGTPIDATAEEVRIETYFPADDATSRLLKDLSRPA